jgi:hypothetical protein
MYIADTAYSEKSKCMQYPTALIFVQKFAFGRAASIGYKLQLKDTAWIHRKI